MRAQAHMLTLPHFYLKHGLASVKCRTMSWHAMPSTATFCSSTPCCPAASVRLTHHLPPAMPQLVWLQQLCPVCGAGARGAAVNHLCLRPLI